MTIMFSLLLGSCATYNETRKADPTEAPYAPLDKVKPGNNFQNQR